MLDKIKQLLCSFQPENIKLARELYKSQKISNEKRPLAGWRELIKNCLDETFYHENIKERSILIDELERLNKQKKIMAVTKIQCPDLREKAVAYLKKLGVSASSIREGQNENPFPISTNALYDKLYLHGYLHAGDFYLMNEFFKDSETNCLQGITPTELPDISIFYE